MNFSWMSLSSDREPPIQKKSTRKYSGKKFKSAILLALKNPGKKIDPLPSKNLGGLLWKYFIYEQELQNHRSEENWK